ncbi:outer membrane protein assembly factor BamB family protein [Mangrovibacterium lignilyticum]|uniref:outer membrane protein assembly factor BamB family protein n=1 Tax=Mangrovibacterium lignilyticum TaxID=2668052 RepID=UPI0013D1F420|nr:PQQ-binding-like beta-propeller repeat protein [Mangrovibacterium lignilyticum]
MMTINDKKHLARGLAWFGAIFSLVVSVMLIANYFQLKSVDPLESPALKVLVEQLHENPHDDVLKENIRALDLMIRKAYFTSQWQIRTGTWMLILGVLVLILSIRWQKSLRNELDELESIDKNPFLDKQLARKGVIYTALGIFMLALLSGFLSGNILDQYDSTKGQDQEADSAVEIIVAKPVEQNSETIADSSKSVSMQEKTSDEIVEVPINEELDKKEEIESKSEEVKKIKSEPTVPSREQIRKNYPFFRGPDGDGMSYKTGVPKSFDGPNVKNVLWKASVPKHGYNSPIIWNDRLFLTGADSEARMVYCFDKNSGKLLWESAADNIPGSPAKMPKVTEDTGLAASTMATDGQAVFAIFATGDLIALDFEGKRLWAKNLGVPDNHYGHSSSLVIYKNKLLIQYDTNKGGKLIALSTADGSQKWETTRNVKISWASPVLVNTGTRDEIILTADPLVAGYDPETGKELWTVECMMGEVGPSVAYANGLVYAANEYATMAAIRLGGSPEIIWEEQEYLPEVASPLAANGLLIVATSYGVLACYDAETGDKYWEHEAASGFYASPVYADSNAYAIDMSGKMYVIRMAKEFELVAESNLGEKAFGTPVFSEGKLYLRGVENLYCIGGN